MNRDKILSVIFSNNLCNETCKKILLDNEVISFFADNRLTSLYCNLIKENNIINNFPLTATQLIKNDAITKRQQKAVILELKVICDYLREHDIEFLIVKGPILSLQLYNDYLYRYYVDIDILLLRFQTDILQVLEFFKRKGYHQEFGWNERQEINTQQLIKGERVDHHEVVCVKGINNLYEFELKNTLSAVPTESIQKFTKHTDIYSVDGITIKSFDLMYSFLVLCSNTFLNSESRTVALYTSFHLRHYYDVYMFIKKYRKILEPLEIFKNSNSLYLYLRLKRVISNLLHILNYNKKIQIDNRDIIEWCERILEAGINWTENANKYIPNKDIFLENKPSIYEIIDWENSFIDRIFSNDKRQTIRSYKNSISSHSIKCFLEKSTNELNANINITKNNKKFLITIEQEISESSIYKIEFLANLEFDEMFYGFILNKESLDNGYAVIFTSNAMHYERMTDDNVKIETKDDLLLCDVTELINISTFENNKIIIRISKVKLILSDMYQELDSASYQYFLE